GVSPRHRTHAPRIMTLRAFDTQGPWWRWLGWRNPAAAAPARIMEPGPLRPTLESGLTDLPSIGPNESSDARGSYDSPRIVPWGPASAGATLAPWFGSRSGSST